MLKPEAAIIENNILGPGLVVEEQSDVSGRSPETVFATEGDRFGSESDGIVSIEATEGGWTTNRMPETGVDGGLYKAEADDGGEQQVERVQRLGERVTARVTEFARDHMPNKLLVGAAAVAMTVGFGGNTVANADNTERAKGLNDGGKTERAVSASASITSEKAGATTSAVKNLGPKPAKYGYVSKEMLPLAKDFIKTFRSAKRSEREVQRGTTGINTDYRNLTYLRVAKVARVKGDRSARGGAFYFNTAYFRGQIRPKNMVEFTISKDTEAARYSNRGFTFSGGKTKQPGPYGIITPRLWTIDTWTGGSGSDQYDSCTINPNINEGEGYWPTLSLPIVNAGIREARKVLAQTRSRRPLGPQRDVFAGMKPAKRCK